MENISLWLAGGGSAVTLWVLKKIPNDTIKSLVFNIFYRIGVVATLGFAKWKLTKSIWNSVMEPYFVDVIDNVGKSAVDGIIKGLRSDNK